MNKNILITGGSGFIGKYVVNNFDNNNMDFINIDLKNGTDLFDLTPDDNLDFDAVVHLAANLEILNVDPEKEMDLNIRGTVHMLELARQMDIPKFVFISTMDVMGEANKPKKESNKINPLWSYGVSKAASELYVQQYEKLYGINGVIVRPSIVTNIGEWYGRVLTLSMSRIRKNEPLLIFGDGKQQRDFVDVNDVANIIYKSTVMNIKTPIILNAGSGVSRSINEVIDMLINSCQELNIKIPEIKYVNPKVGELGRKLNEQKIQSVDMGKTKQILGISLNTDLQKIITDELQWILGMTDEQFKLWIQIPRY